MLPSAMEGTSDSSFTTSSSSSNSSQPLSSSLNQYGSWLTPSSDGDLWIQVDLGHPQFIVMLRLAPPSNDTSRYVTEATAECSLNGEEFISFADFETGAKQIFEGSNESTTHRTRLHLCRFVRLLPKKWNGSPAFRWDLIRCPSNSNKS